MARRMLSIGKEYEEAAIDLGAPPRAAIRRILLPLQSPEIFANFAIAFGSPTPAVNAAATFLLVTTTVAIVLGTSCTAARRGANGRRASPSSRTSERTYAVAAPSRSVWMGTPVSIKTRSASGGRWTETGWPCA